MIKKFIYIFLIGVILVTLASIVLSFTKSTKAKKTLSLNTVYSYVYNNETDIIEIPYYLDSRINSFSDISQIEGAYITDNKHNKLEIKSLDIKKNKEHSYQKKKYYGYIFLGRLPDLEITMPKAYLLLQAAGEEMQIEIGSLMIKKYENIGNEDKLAIDELFGIIDSSLETPTGIVIRLYNKTDKAIKVKRIELANGVLASPKEIKVLDDTKIGSKDDISNLLGYKYSIYGSVSEEEFNLIVPSYQDVRILLPLKYQNNAYMYKCPLFIYFDDDVLVNDEFMFFDNNFDLSLFQKVVINND